MNIKVTASWRRTAHVLGSVQDVEGKGMEGHLSVLSLEFGSNVCVRGICVVDNLVLVGGHKPLKGMPHHREGHGGLGQLADGK